MNSKRWVELTRKKEEILDNTSKMRRIVKNQIRPGADCPLHFILIEFLLTFEYRIFTNIKNDELEECVELEKRANGFKKYLIMEALVKRLSCDAVVCDCLYYITVLLSKTNGDIRRIYFGVSSLAGIENRLRENNGEISPKNKQEEAKLNWYIGEIQKRYGIKEEDVKDWRSKCAYLTALTRPQLRSSRSSSLRPVSFY